MEPEDPLSPSIQCLPLWPFCLNSPTDSELAPIGRGAVAPSPAQVETESHGFPVPEPSLSISSDLWQSLHPSPRDIDAKSEGTGVHNKASTGRGEYTGGLQRGGVGGPCSGHVREVCGLPHHHRCSVCRSLSWDRCQARQRGSTGLNYARKREQVGWGAEVEAMPGKPPGTP